MELTNKCFAAFVESLFRNIFSGIVFVLFCLTLFCRLDSDCRCCCWWRCREAGNETGIYSVVLCVVRLMHVSKNGNLMLHIMLGKLVCSFAFITITRQLQSEEREFNNLIMEQFIGRSGLAAARRVATLADSTFNGDKTAIKKYYRQPQWFSSRVSLSRVTSRSNGRVTHELRKFIVVWWRQ